MAAARALLLLFLLTDFTVWCVLAQQISKGELHVRANETEEVNAIKEMFPIPEIRYLPWGGGSDNNQKRRKLAPFQLCSGCTCCASENNKSMCTTSACCYSITCGLPDKPYGVCAFTPKACNCTNCGT